MSMEFAWALTAAAGALLVIGVIMIAVGVQRRCSVRHATRNGYVTLGRRSAGWMTIAVGVIIIALAVIVAIVALPFVANT